MRRIYTISFHQAETLLKVKDGECAKKIMKKYDILYKETGWSNLELGNIQVCVNNWKMNSEKQKKADDRILKSLNLTPTDT